MFKVCKIAVVGFFLLASALAAAQGKIAVLDVQGAIVNTNEAQKRLKELRNQTEFKESSADLEKRQKEYNDIIARLQKDLAVMSDEQKEAERKKIESKRADIEHIVRKLQGAQQEVLAILMQEMAPHVDKAVADLVKSENIGLLLDRKAALVVNNEYSITAKVTEQLNKAK